MNDIETTNVDSIESDVSFGLGITCYGKTNFNECFIGYNVFLIKKEMALNGITYCEFAKIHENSELLGNSELFYEDNDAYILAIMKAAEYIKKSDFSSMIKCIYFNAASFDNGTPLPLKNVNRINEEIGNISENFSNFSISEIEDFLKNIETHHIELEHERSNFINYDFAKEIKQLCKVDKQIFVSEQNSVFIEKVKSGEIPPTPISHLSKSERRRLNKMKLKKGSAQNYNTVSHSQLIIHTDGSIHRYGDKSGYGCVVLNSKKEKIFNLIGSIPFVKKKLNIQYVEMYAIYRALVAIKDKIDNGLFDPNVTITIFSDSKNCIECLNGTFVWNGHADSEILKNLYKNIHSLGLKVYYENVKGHSGDEFNEYADALARQGAMKDFKGELISYYGEYQKVI